MSELKIIGRHNIENALAALALGHAAGLPFAAMIEALKNFKGLEHRCQFVDSINGVKYYRVAANHLDFKWNKEEEA